MESTGRSYALTIHTMGGICHLNGTDIRFFSLLSLFFSNYMT
jgi:hypothetical protein